MLRAGEKYTFASHRSKKLSVPSGSTKKQSFQSHCDENLSESLHSVNADRVPVQKRENTCSDHNVTVNAVPVIASEQGLLPLDGNESDSFHSVETEYESQEGNDFKDCSNVDEKETVPLENEKNYILPSCEDKVDGFQSHDKEHFVSISTTVKYTSEDQNNKPSNSTFSNTGNFIDTEDRSIGSTLDGFDSNSVTSNITTTGIECINRCTSPVSSLSDESEFISYLLDNKSSLTLTSGFRSVLECRQDEKEAAKKAKKAANKSVSTTRRNENKNVSPSRVCSNSKENVSTEDNRATNLASATNSQLDNSLNQIVSSDLKDGTSTGQTFALHRDDSSSINDEDVEVDNQCLSSHPSALGQNQNDSDSNVQNNTSTVTAPLSSQSNNYLNENDDSNNELDNRSANRAFNSHANGSSNSIISDSSSTRNIENITNVDTSDAKKISTEESKSSCDLKSSVALDATNPHSEGSGLLNPIRKGTPVEKFYPKSSVQPQCRRFTSVNPRPRYENFHARQSNYTTRSSRNWRVHNYPGRGYGKNIPRVHNYPGRRYIKNIPSKVGYGTMCDSEFQSENSSDSHHSTEDDNSNENGSSSQTDVDIPETDPSKRVYKLNVSYNNKSCKITKIKKNAKKICKNTIDKYIVDVNLKPKRRIEGNNLAVPKTAPIKNSFFAALGKYEKYSCVSAKSKNLSVPSGSTKEQSLCVHCKKPIEQSFCGYILCHFNQSQKADSVKVSNRENTFSEHNVAVDAVPVIACEQGELPLDGNESDSFHSIGTEHASHEGNDFRDCSIMDEKETVPLENEKSDILPSCGDKVVFPSHDKEHFVSISTTVKSTSEDQNNKPSNSTFSNTGNFIDTDDISMGSSLDDFDPNSVMSNVTTTIIEYHRDDSSSKNDVEVDHQCLSSHPSALWQNQSDGDSNNVKNNTSSLTTQLSTQYNNLNENDDSNIKQDGRSADRTFNSHTKDSSNVIITDSSSTKNIENIALRQVEEVERKELAAPKIVSNEGSTSQTCKSRTTDNFESISTVENQSNNQTRSIVVKKYVEYCNNAMHFLRRISEYKSNLSNSESESCTEEIKPTNPDLIANEPRFIPMADKVIQEHSKLNRSFSQIRKFGSGSSDSDSSSTSKPLVKKLKHEIANDSSMQYIENALAALSIHAEELINQEVSNSLLTGSEQIQQTISSEIKVVSNDSHSNIVPVLVSIEPYPSSEPSTSINYPTGNTVKRESKSLSFSNVEGSRKKETKTIAKIIDGGIRIITQETLVIDVSLENANLKIDDKEIMALSENTYHVKIVGNNLRNPSELQEETIQLPGNVIEVASNSRSDTISNGANVNAENSTVLQTQEAIKQAQIAKEQCSSLLKDKVLFSTAHTSTSETFWRTMWHNKMFPVKKRLTKTKSTTRIESSSNSKSNTLEERERGCIPRPKMRRVSNSSAQSSSS
ncbi:hypothetical protein C0J52_13288 [Blattella germanica]|nr:hypothetical protein C0J52_13288 [Blattella germanica]